MVLLFAVGLLALHTFYRDKCQCGACGEGTGYRTCNQTLQWFMVHAEMNMAGACWHTMQLKTCKDCCWFRNSP